MNALERARVLKVLEQTITPEAVDWQDIVSAVQAAGIDVKNWLDVRSVLQQMINARLVSKVKSVRVEQYYRTPA